MMRGPPADFYNGELLIEKIWNLRRNGIKYI